MGWMKAFNPATMPRSYSRTSGQTVPEVVIGTPGSRVPSAAASASSSEGSR